MPRRTVVVLTYHGLGDAPGASTVFRRRIQDFEDDLDLIDRLGYSVLSFRDLLGRDVLTHDAVVITFDDGLMSQVDHGVPALKRRQVKATFCVPTSLIGAARHHFTLDTLAELAEVQAAHGGRLFDLAIHGHRHVNYRDLTEAEMGVELQQARGKFWEARISPLVLALPFGDFNSASIQAVARDHGFLVVRTAIGGVLDQNNLLDTPSYLIHRDTDLEELLSRRSQWPLEAPVRRPKR